MVPPSTVFSIQFTPDQQPVTYSVRISKRARRYCIIISQDGVEVVLPYRTSPEKAREVLLDHAEWVRTQLQKLERRQKRLGTQKLPPNVILLQGQPFTVVCSKTSAARPKVTLERGRSILNVHLPTGAARRTGRILEAWLRTQARPLIEQQVNDR